MIAITSIAPGHKNYDNQINAVNSWIESGYEVVSMNSNEEIEGLKEKFANVKFVSTNRHNKKMFGKPYVIVSAILDYLLEVKSEYSLIVNSDIIINDKSGYTKKLNDISKDGIVIINRYDYDENIEAAKIYEEGFDGFFISEKFLSVFPQTLLCLGQCHWDYWLPYTASINGANIIKSKVPYLFHKKHPVQYSVENWTRTAEIFRSEIGILKYKNVGQVTAIAYKHIKNSLV